MTDWVRLWHDMPTDPKWRTIARKSKQPLVCVIALFNLLMVNASGNADERGCLRNWDDEDAAAALDMEPEDVTAIMDAMQGKVLDGNRLTGWEKRQPKREDDGAASRKRAERERKRAQDHDASRNVTQRHAPETEADAETEELEPNGSRPTRVGPEPVAEPVLVDLVTPAEPVEDPNAIRPEHVVEEWNKLADRLSKPRVRDLTPERRQLLKARIAQYGLDDFLTVFGKIEGSAFLRGDTGSSFCTFDWVFKKANFQKILEGNYDR